MLKTQHKARTTQKQRTTPLGWHSSGLLQCHFTRFSSPWSCESQTIMIDNHDKVVVVAGRSPYNESCLQWCLKLQWNWTLDPGLYYIIFSFNESINHICPSLNRMENCLVRNGKIILGNGINSIVQQRYNRDTFINPLHFSVSTARRAIIKKASGKSEK